MIPRRSDQAGDLPFSDEVVLITGASRGIGRAAAERFEAQGARVISIQRTPGAGEWIAADLSQIDEAVAAVEEATCRFGRLDVCVNAAGINHREAAMTMSVDAWQKVLTVNLTAAFIVTRGAARQFVAQGSGGRIIHVASELSFFGGQGVAAYSASKGGVAQLTKSQANEWAQHDIRVNAVAPGWIETELTSPLRSDEVRFKEITDRIPVGHWGTPDDVARVITWLASEEARYMHGAVVVVDGGYMVH